VVDQIAKADHLQAAAMTHGEQLTNQQSAGIDLAVCLAQTQQLRPLKQKDKTQSKVQTALESSSRLNPFNSG
jgi:hypothetical protein